MRSRLENIEEHVQLVDSLGRNIDYIRISVTDRCNLRCVYCMPAKGVEYFDVVELMTFEEILLFIKAASELGIKKIRITGGGQIDNVLLGIRAAEDAGLLPIKLNMVPLKGVNDDEIEDFVRLSITTGYQVRFIELMPTRVNMADSIGKLSNVPISSMVSADEIKRYVEKIAPIYPVKLRRSGPARYYRFDGYEGVFGIISAVTCRFCQECNRLRLTAVGALKPCLYSGTQVDVKTMMRFGATREDIKKLIIVGAELKPQKHNIDNDVFLDAMSRIGG